MTGTLIALQSITAQVTEATQLQPLLPPPSLLARQRCSVGPDSANDSGHDNRADRHTAGQHASFVCRPCMRDQIKHAMDHFNHRDTHANGAKERCGVGRVFEPGLGLQERRIGVTSVFTQSIEQLRSETGIVSQVTSQSSTNRHDN